MVPALLDERVLGDLLAQSELKTSRLHILVLFSQLPSPSLLFFFLRIRNVFLLPLSTNQTTTSCFCFRSLLCTISTLTILRLFFFHFQASNFRAVLQLTFAILDFFRILVFRLPQRVVFQSHSIHISN